jgi:hypothetical protein
VSAVTLHSRGEIGWMGKGILRRWAVLGGLGVIWE